MSSATTPDENEGWQRNSYRLEISYNGDNWILTFGPDKPLKEEDDLYITSIKLPGSYGIDEVCDQIGVVVSGSLEQLRASGSLRDLCKKAYAKGRAELTNKLIQAVEIAQRKPYCIL